MNQVAYRWPRFGSILPDGLAFAIGLSIAWRLGWKTTDLVWSLWLGSLVLGYLTILSTIGGGLYMVVNTVSHEEVPQKNRLTGILIGGGTVLFYLGFFSFHFCGFHAGHACLLSLFFPIEGLPSTIEGLPSTTFEDALMNPVLLWKTVFHHLLPVYGVFLVPVLIAERRYVFASIIAAVKEVHVEMPRRPARDSFNQIMKGRDNSLTNSFARPYLNVIRMHLLIFFFILCHLLKMESFFIYAVVYGVYFFPWTAFQEDAAETQTDAT